MSQNLETPEPGGPNLRRALAHLSAHEPDPGTWARIEARLTAESARPPAWPTLPGHAPDADLWAAIAARLDSAEASFAPRPPAVLRPLWPARTGHRALALAASMLLLLGIWWQLRPVASGPTVARETVTFSEEAGAPSLPAPVADPLELQGLSFIDTRCSSQPVVCQSQQFRSLRTQLQELESQEVQLRQAAYRFGSSPELLREQARVITLKASFTRQLVQLLIS